MKPHLIVTATVAIIAPMRASAAAPLDYDRLADAIAAKETGGRWNGTPGAAGELSIYQLTRAVWRQHSALPFAVAAYNERTARAVAIAHMKWLAGILTSRALPPTPALVASAYHRGWTRIGQVDSYGLAVENLYRDPGFSLHGAPVTVRNQ